MYPWYYCCVLLCHARSERAREEVGAVFEGVSLGKPEEETKPLVIPR